MRCPKCEALFDVGAKRFTWSACPHCKARVWLADDPALDKPKPVPPRARPVRTGGGGNPFEIDPSCPGLQDPSTGIALTRSGDIGMFRDLKVFIDGVQVGRLAHDQRKVFRAFPGSRGVHVAMDWCTSEPFHVNVAEGQIVELRCRPALSAANYYLNTFMALFTPNRFFIVGYAK